MPWSAQIHTPFHVWRITQELPRVLSDFDYGGFTLYAGAFHLLHLSFKIPHRGPTTPETSLRFGLFRFRSPLLTESILFLFLRLLRCFTSPGIAYLFLPSIAGFRKERWSIKTTRLPHSEISGSKRICRSPKLIAAYHVLHRLLAPRHSLCALKSLIPCLKSATQTCFPEENGFHALSVFQPTYSRIFYCYRIPAVFAVKICIWELEYIQGPRKNGSRDFSRSFNLYCSQSNHISLHMDVKERTRFQKCGTNYAFNRKWWA